MLRVGNDAALIASTCQAYGLKTPLRYRLDLSQHFQALLLLKQTPGLKDAVGILGLSFDGIPHGALVDARNTARIHAAIIRRMRRKSDPTAPPAQQPAGPPSVTPFGEMLRQAITKEHS